MVPGQETSQLNPQEGSQKHILPHLALSLLLLVAITSTSNVHAFTPPTPMSKELQSTLTHYLDADCGTEPKDPKARKKPFGPLLTLLRFQDDPDLEARLLEILKLGLYPDDIDRTKLALGKEWEKIGVRINTAIGTGAKKPSSLLTKESYVNQHLAWRVQENQQKAAVALVLLNTPKAMAALDLAAAQDEVVARTIKRTYRRFSITPGIDTTTIKHSALTTRTQK